MKTLKKPGLSLALLFLALYLAITLGPAAVYGAAKMAGEEGTALTGPTPEAAPTAPASPQPEGSPLPPGFLEGQSLPQEEEAGEGEDVFTVYDVATEEVYSVPAREFVASALACEMDLSSPQEALKAQAVAAYTYYSRQREKGEKVQGADFACDSGSWLVYVPESGMQARWGESYGSNWALLLEAVDAVQGQALTWEGELALSSYFAISPGSTEAAANVWDPSAGESFPYLQAVASPGDRFSDGYMASLSFTEEEFQTACAAYFADDPPDFSGSSEGWLTGLVYTPSGMVREAVLGGKAVTGTALREALSLRSACFTLEVQDGMLVFTTRGWGHGVGMSQAGAVFLAEQGADYTEILAHYYPGAQLTPLR